MYKSYSEAQAIGRSRRGQSAAVVHMDDAPYQRPIVFTYGEMTELRYTEAQVYEHAAQIIRARDRLSDRVAVFPRGSYDATSEVPTYTLKAMSDKVQRLLGRGYY